MASRPRGDTPVVSPRVMSQTLFSVLALALLSLLVFGSLSRRNQDRTERAQRLANEEARGLVMGLLERAAALPFDDAAPGRTLPADFGPGPGAVTGPELDAAFAAGAFRDLDDLHGVASTAHVTHQHPGLESPLVFTVGFETDYVRSMPSGWAATTDTTAQKRLVVHLAHPRIAVTQRLERVYTEGVR